MRKIFIAIGLFIILGIVAVNTPSCCSSSKVSPTLETTTVAERITTFDPSQYYGDSLASVDGITFYVDYGDGDESDVSSIDGSYIVAMRDTMPLAASYIKGEYNTLQCSGSMLEIVSGIDTLIYDITQLPPVIDIIAPIVLTGAKESNYKKTFALSDSSWNCDFAAQFFIMPDDGQWLYNCINTVIHDDIDEIMLADSVSLVKWFHGNKHDLKAMSGFYAKELERLYRNDYGDPDEDGIQMGPKYDYLFRLMPVWESKDKDLVTYKFYTFQYMGGVHGSMDEYFFTFNRKTGKLLGANDLFTKGGFNETICELEKQLHEYKVNNGYADREWTVYVEDCPTEFPYNGTKYDLKESVSGHVYPRPALTRHGIVFSYQPYEMGSFAEGILHFVVPYKSIYNPRNSTPADLRHNRLFP